MTFSRPDRPFEPIAVVAQSCVLPGALDPEALWAAVESGEDLVSAVPEGRWALSPGHAMTSSPKESQDRTWCDRGGYVRGFDGIFDPSGFRLPEEEILKLDPLFRWVLHTGREALRAAEAGADGASKDAANRRTGVVLGNLSFPSASANRFAEQLWLRQVGLEIPGSSGDDVDPKNRFTSGLPAHLLSHALGLGGGAFALDAACASSLYALKLACDRLHDRRADRMLAGAVSCADDLFIHIGFCALEAMSASGRSRPFHRGADGLLPAEGAAFVALERLDDAVRHGRHILGVIRGIGLSNDGRGRGLLAPAQEGQVRAIRRAYAQSGLRPEDVSLVECHATGTPVGDATEIQSLTEIYQGLSDVPVGSLKSNLGHLITAAGLAGLVKILGAMKAGVRPPTLHVDDPNPVLEGSPFRLLRKAEPWTSPPGGGPKRAALSAFGFGGNNAHLLVEEYVPAPAASVRADHAYLPSAFVTEEIDLADPDGEAGFVTEELELPSALREDPIAVVAVEVVAAGADGVEDFEKVLFSRSQDALSNRPDGTREGVASDLHLAIKGLRFPPKDLEQTLPQQLLLLQAARRLAPELVDSLPRESTGVLVGMQCDAEIARYGLRWRLAEWSEAWREQGLDTGAEWTAEAREAAVAGLKAAGVVGTMPNIPANRLNNQLDLGGPSATFSSEELSGLVALDLAVRSLRAGEMDAAVVGAVDLCCEPVHQAAARALLPASRHTPGDAAVLLVLRRLSDAEEQGQPVLAVIDDVSLGADTSSAAGGENEIRLGGDGEDPTAVDLTPRLGHAHAASGLLHVAAAVLACRHRAVPADSARPGRPWPGRTRRARVDVTSRLGDLQAQHGTVVVSRASQGERAHPPAGPLRWPRFVVIEGTDRGDLLRRLAELASEGASEDPNGGSNGAPRPARLVLHGADDEALAAARSRAAEALRSDDAVHLAGDGFAFRERPIAGDTAFVFTGAAAAYAGMGRDLLLASPELHDALDRRMGEAARAASWVYDGEGDPPDVLRQLWGASYLCQAHAELGRTLGLVPQAAIGYSSGESNSLMALGAWNDLEALYRDTREGGLFTRELGGPMDAVARSWGLEPGQKPAWANRIVRAPAEAVRRAVAAEERVYVTIVNSPDEVVIGGEPGAVERVCRDLDAPVYPLGYPMAVHCPEVDAVREPWLDLHRRPTEPVEGVRFYTHADGGRAYVPDRESAAQAILGQALGTVDFPAMVDKAWDDGVRIFVEHGPRGLCSRWIRACLDARGIDRGEYLAVPWDRLGPSSLDRAAETVAELLAAGLDLDHARLWDRPARAYRPEGPTLRFAAHWPPVQLPTPAPSRAASADATDSLSRSSTSDPLPRPRTEPVSTPEPTAVLPSSTAAKAADLPGDRPQVMAPAPALPSVFFDPPDAGPSSTNGSGPTTSPAEHSAPLPLPEAVPVIPAAPATASGFGSSLDAQPTSATGAVQAVPVDPSDFTGRALAGMAEIQARLAQAQRSFLDQQNRLHRQFLDLRGRELERLAGALHLPIQGAPSVAPAEPFQETSQAPAPAPTPAPVVSRPPVAPEPVATPAPVPAEPPRPTAAAPVLEKPAPPVAQAASVEARPQTPEPEDLPGPKIDREGLLTLASGKISDIFGPEFRGQDAYPRQVRMPEPPFLFADRVTGIQGEPLKLGTGTIWTETDVTDDAWYLHRGRMPGGLMIEAGQADLLLISWQGIDFLNKSERVYRLLGCELTYRGELPKPGDTLKYDIHIDGHAKQGDVRLFFFHYDCRIDGETRLEVRSGQAGFFTDQELDDSAGVLWNPDEVQLEAGRVDPPAISCEHRSFGREQLVAFSEGRLFDCMGPGFELGAAHTLTPSIQTGRLMLLDQVTDFDPAGGPWGRGYLRATAPVTPEDWIFEGHFHNDPCMPGTLMFEVCLQTMAVYMAAMGFTVERDGWRFQPVADIPYPMRCRGQVDPTSRELVYEVFVREVWNDAEPKLFADLLVTVDGLKAFHAEGVGLELVPDWPMSATPEIAEQPFPGGERPEGRPVAEVDGFRFDYDTLLACAWGKPSHAFGDMYRPFDGPRTVARLPGPPYHFMSRIREIHGEMGAFESGARIVTEYDVPPEEWYFHENGFPTMPYAVLLEAALQPCGWLASFIGSALTAGDTDLQFRNLDGTATLHRDILPDAGILQNHVKLTATSSSAGVIIVRFEVLMLLDGSDDPIFTMRTAFGFFPKAAMASQAGLPASEEELEIFRAPSEYHVDLTEHPSRFFDGSARLGRDKLLVLDRVTGYWPDAGEAGLGRMRAEKTVDPAEWFFKAHFFQDPVQPGSLGIEAMIQLLQVYMLERGLDADVPGGRFEPIALGTPLTWKYRGQVIPKNGTITTQIEVTEVGRDDQGVYAVADAWLWVDGKRIYSAVQLGMRIVPDDDDGAPSFDADSDAETEWDDAAAATALAAAAEDLDDTVVRTVRVIEPEPEAQTEPAAEPRAVAAPTPDEEILDPEHNAWLLDHCPTWTIPALPMMSMVDRLAAAALRRFPTLGISGLEDVQVRRWIAFPDGPVRLRTVVESEERHKNGTVGLVVALQVWRESARPELSRFETAASGKVWLAPGPGWTAAPAPLPDLPEAGPVENPYATGTLFHGPAFQLLQGLHLSPPGSAVAGSSAVLDAAAGSVPWGTLHPGLLDAATHGIPHDAMERWSSEIPEGYAAYPSCLEAAHFFGPPPTSGPVRCEARFEGVRPGIEGGPAMPLTRLQLIAGDRVWADLLLREILLPKGRLGTAPPERRRAFLRDRIPSPGVALSRFSAAATHLFEAEVAAADWLPGTVARAYGARSADRFALTREVAIKDHLSRHTGDHPASIDVDLATASGVAAGQPLTRWAVSVTLDEAGEVSVRDEHPPTLDVGPLRRYWRDYFGRQDPWIVEDVYYGLIERYVRRVVITHPEAFRAVYGRPALFLANHQVMIESLLFSTLASALLGVPTVTLAKDEHQTTWLGELIAHCFSYPGIVDPGLITFFERDNPRSLPPLIRSLGERMGSGERAVMVHSEGTRSLTCRKPVELLSGSFIDMAMKNGAPIIPVRFVGGLPAEPLDERIEFPLGHGRQDYWFGEPILPEQLEPMKYRDRRTFVLDAMNRVGPPHADEAPFPGRPAFAAEVDTWQQQTGASPEHAAIYKTLEKLENPVLDTRRLIEAASSGELRLGSGDTEQWLGELARRLYGPNGPRIVGG